MYRTHHLYFAHTDLVNGSHSLRPEANGQVHVQKTLIDAMLPRILNGTDRWLSFKGLTEAGPGAVPEDLGHIEVHSHPRFAFQGFQIDSCVVPVHRSQRLQDRGAKEGHTCDELWIQRRALRRRAKSCPMPECGLQEARQAA